MTTDEVYERIVAEQAKAFLFDAPDPDDDWDDDEEEDGTDSWLDPDLPPVVWAAAAVDLVDAGEYPAFPCGAD
jgi:hypothetical protein